MAIKCSIKESKRNLYILEYLIIRARRVKMKKNIERRMGKMVRRRL